MNIETLVDYDKRVSELLARARTCNSELAIDELIELGVDPLGNQVDIARASELWLKVLSDVA